MSGRLLSSPVVVTGQGCVSGTWKTGSGLGLSRQGRMSSIQEVGWGKLLDIMTKCLYIWGGLVQDVII